MAQDDQLRRLQRMRDARQGAGTRLEPVRGVQPRVLEQHWPGAAPAVAPKGHGRALAGLVTLFVLAAVVLGGIGYVFHSFHSSVGGPTRDVQFVVRPGESVSAIASELQQQNLVSSSLLFQLYYRLNGGSDAIHYGTHHLTTAMTMEQVAQALQVVPPLPKSDVFQITLLGGKRVEQIAQLLAESSIATEKDVLHEVQHGKFNYWFLKGRPKGATLEGFLYPGTYTVHPHIGAHRMIGLMLANFNRHFTPAMRSALKHSGRSVFEVITIASIVQRESSRAKDLPYIAGVYFNRLTNTVEVAMRLQADPTVQYALGYRPKEHSWWETHLTQDMYGTDSPYNTYKVQGLPPGPIDSPNGQVIAAALHPAKSDYLYFEVLTKKPNHARTYFCQTLQCQQDGTGVTID